MFSKLKAFTSNNNLNSFNKMISKGFRNNFNKKLNTGSAASSASSYLKYVLLGLGVGGLSYLSYQGGSLRDEKLKTMLSSANLVHESIVIQRTKDTLAYFGAGLGLTSILTYGMMRSPAFLNFYSRIASKPFMYLMLTIPTMLLTMYGMNKPPLPENTLIKHASWFAFNTVMSFTIAPFVYMAGAQLAAQASLITAGAVGGLAYVAYNSKNDAFLGLNGFLAAGSGVMFACAVASFFTNSALVHNIWLYGGLGLFLAYVLYDVNQIKIKAERSPVFDPMSQSIHIYMDTINIFIRILMILDNKKRNK
jgi:growth hormone-inducible transmembrane protein